MRANLLAFAGRTDSIAPPAAVRAQVDAVGSADATFRLAPGGHMGLFAGASAPKHVWQPAAEWLARALDRAPAAARAPARADRRAQRPTRGPQRARRAAQH